MLISFSFPEEDKINCYTLEILSYSSLGFLEMSLSGDEKLSKSTLMS